MGLTGMFWSWFWEGCLAFENVIDLDLKERLFC